MSPGCKFDFMPVLIGPQGTLKSTAIKVLFSFAWSTENKGHFDSKKEFVEESAGFWVIEHDEMADFGRAKDEEGIKSTLSRTHDTVREAYGRKAGTVPRQCVLVGTTNKTTFLRTSHRRIWPINCGERSLDTAWLRANRDQLWAEAVHAYREMDARSVDGILPLYLHDKAAAVEFAVLQPGYLMPDADEANSGAVQEWLDRPTPKSVARPGAPYEDDIDAKFDEEELVQRTVTCGKEIWEKALGNDPTKYDSRAALAVGRIMEFLQTVWTKADPVRCGKYGVQRVYRRISTRRDRKKAR
jgi:hypothetical protein